MERQKIILISKVSLIVACLGGGAWLIVDYALGMPPDPNTADLETASQFMYTKYFNRLSADYKREYAYQLSLRRKEMTKEERKEQDGRLSSWFKSKGEEWIKAQQKMMFDSIKNQMVSSAEEYVKLPLDQRDAYLENHITRWETLMKFGPMAGGPPRPREGDGPVAGSKENENKKERNPDRPFKSMNSESYQKMLGFHKKIDEQVNAVQRASITKMLVDMAPKAERLRPKS